jgi:hypothetical protein
MNKQLRDQEKNDAISRNALLQAARIMGAMGGKAGTGAAKRRPKEVYQRAARKRWEAHDNEKMARRKIKAD